MRPNQQSNKNRQRGRNNNSGRKHLNPLSRNYESNGPDVKVRGNAAHVAEKYLQLARDAQSSGDSVMAENYLQHAEHYFRIVSAAQQQQMARTDQQPSQAPASDDEDDDFPPINDRFSSPEPANRFQPEQQQGEVRQPAEAGEAAAEGAPAEASAQGDEQAAQGDGEGEGQRRHRDRRRRRRSGAAADGTGVDPGEAPQPDVELPAFLTGNPAAAE